MIGKKKVKPSCDNFEYGVGENMNVLLAAY